MNKASIRKPNWAAVIGLGLTGLSLAAQASVIPLGSGAYLQNFDTLASSGSSSVLPAGWSATEFGPSADNFYSADNGSSTVGGIYSYGATGSGNRAFGELRGNDGTEGFFGAEFQNSSSIAINKLNISYVGEEWRLGQVGSKERLDLQISFNATSLTTGTWVDEANLSFQTPNTTGVGAHDGTLAANQKNVNGTISFLNITPGTTFWIRWADVAPAGQRFGDGLAVDNLVITAVPEASSALAAVAALGFMGAYIIRRRNGGASAAGTPQLG